MTSPRCITATLFSRNTTVGVVGVHWLAFSSIATVDDYVQLLPLVDIAAEKTNWHPVDLMKQYSTTSIS